jgi:hypothetical protein
VTFLSGTDNNPSRARLNPRVAERLDPPHDGNQLSYREAFMANEEHVALLYVALLDVSASPLSGSGFLEQEIELGARYGKQRGA